MLKHTYKKVVAVAAVLLSLLIAPAQNDISSPYSMYGIGLLSNVTSGAYDAMGKVGYAMQNPYLINFKNPASYVAFDSLSFIGDVAFSILSSTLSTDVITQKATYARPDYFAFGLPVTSHWRTCVSVMPFSNLGYSISDNRMVENIGAVSYLYSGSGGLFQVCWGNAFKICKGLSIGLNASYLFGNLAYSESASFDGENFFNAMNSRIIDLDGIYLSAGIQYFVNVKGKHTLGFGIVYENSAYIWAKQTDFAYTYTISASSPSDTVKYETKKGNLQMPQTIGGGFSYQYKDKLWITADVSWQNWKKLHLSTETMREDLSNSMSYSVGVQFIPDASSSNYAKKLRLRIGARYSTGYINATIGQTTTTISDFSISAGVGLPLKLFTSNSSIGILFEYGQMGTHRNNLIKESYFRFSLHFTLQEKWYQRVKLD
ncbi:MAG: hypothetical protein IJT61_07495 [Bacteroidales bacterium]|nr:hypothetical protein [Bacteroidales bacterium]